MQRFNFWRALILLARRLLHRKVQAGFAPGDQIVTVAFKRWVLLNVLYLPTALRNSYLRSDGQLRRIDVWVHSMRLFFRLKNLFFLHF